MDITVNPQLATDAITDALYANLVPYLIGSPGVGKSSIMQQIAKNNKLKYVDIRLAQSDPTDLSGMPFVIDSGKRMDFIPPSHFPLEGDDIPNGYEGWLINFDEINSAPPAVQVAAYKVLLDREVGQHKIHERVRMVAAGNLVTDRAVVNRLGTAMQSRLIHFQLEVSSDDWIDWALTHDIDLRVVSFIRFRPELLHKFDPNHTDVTFPTPRTWEFVSTQLKLKGWEKFGDKPHHLINIIGTIGQGAAIEFKAFLELFNELPDPDMIIIDPVKSPVPSEPGSLYALTTLLQHKINPSNCTNVITYIKRLPKEFQVLSVTDIMKHKPSLRSELSMQKWMRESASDIFGETDA